MCGCNKRREKEEDWTSGYEQGYCVIPGAPISLNLIYNFWNSVTRIFKGTVSRDFLLLVFFMNQFPPSPRVFHLDRFEFFRKFAEIFASQGAPPVSTTPAAKLPPVSTTPMANLPPVSATPVANFSTIFASVVDTGGKFAAGVNDTSGKFATGVNDAGGKLPPVSMTPAANLPPVSTTPVANNGTNIRLQIP
jgi:hypothetical protein